ncbi:MULTISPECIES: transglutaminase-like domain-containing protein [unclassified Streptomyces]|uniref:transglutaminase-like domain-containing protein n=1 Tax=unclassified Streptomyces TaxID=2593676 RepID=UPI00342D5684
MHHHRAHEDRAGSPWRRRFAEEARADRPDLALLCLLIGTEADEEFGEEGIDAAQIELDRLSGALPYGVRGPGAQARALGGLLGGREGFHGVPADYRRLESSLLHEVLRRRRGLPILLSVVWTEVARRAGWPVYGVALPGHFVVGFGEADGQVLADPFAAGRTLSPEDAGLLVAGGTGTALTPEMLEPADPRAVVTRILNNVRAWASARPERSDVALWALDLLLLLPSHPARLRYERARLLVQRGSFTEGAAEMEAYADVVAAVEPAAAEALRSQARGARARLN